MFVLGFDLETNGLDLELSRIIELGAVLWHIEEAKPVVLLSHLTNHPGETVTVSDDIAALTGISQKDFDEFAAPFPPVLGAFTSLMSRVDVVAVMAHNGIEFDWPMLANHARRLGVTLPQVPLIDTMIDVPYPPQVKARKLTHLAAEHGFLNPFPHRAVFDVLTMLNIASRYPFAAMLESCQQPLVTLQAICRKPWEDNGESTNKAKEHGFRWDGNRKLWLKKIRAGAAREFPFETIEVSS